MRAFLIPSNAAWCSSVSSFPHLVQGDLQFLLCGVTRERRGGLVVSQIMVIGGSCYLEIGIGFGIP
uniref:Uncharacterized protein n=1 Tax=Romanomermis culicivorax TaxID=13658 RepID=A0A915JXB1_ROMCU